MLSLKQTLMEVNLVETGSQERIAKEIMRTMSGQPKDSLVGFLEEIIIKVLPNPQDREKLLYTLKHNNLSLQ